MSDELAETYRQEGALLTQAAECRRCLAILRHPSAWLRPEAAWRFLPLHKSVEATIRDLLEQPVECAVRVAKLHDDNVAFYEMYAQCVATDLAQWEAQFETIN